MPKKQEIEKETRADGKGTFDAPQSFAFLVMAS